MRQLNYAGTRLSLLRAATPAERHTPRPLLGRCPHRAGLTPFLASAVTDTIFCQEQHHGEVSTNFKQRGNKGSPHLRGVTVRMAWWLGDSSFARVGEGPGDTLAAVF